MYTLASITAASPPSHSPLKVGEEHQQRVCDVSAVQRFQIESVVSFFSPLQGGVRGGHAAVTLQASRPQKIQRVNIQP